MSHPTRLEIDLARQIISPDTADHAYEGGRTHALAARTLGCIEGYLRTPDPARAVRLVRAALRAERELQAAGTPEYDTIMEDSNAERPETQPARPTAAALAAATAAAQARAAAAPAPDGDARQPEPEPDVTGRMTITAAGAAKLDARFGPGWRTATGTR